VIPLQTKSRFSVTLICMLPLSPTLNSTVHGQPTYKMRAKDKLKSYFRPKSRSTASNTQLSVTGENSATTNLIDLTGESNKTSFGVDPGSVPISQATSASILLPSKDSEASIWDEAVRTLESDLEGEGKYFKQAMDIIKQAECQPGRTRAIYLEEKLFLMKRDCSKTGPFMEKLRPICQGLNAMKSTITDIASMNPTAGLVFSIFFTGLAVSNLPTLPRMSNFTSDLTIWDR
jgi:hypothetical protein